MKEISILKELDFDSDVLVISFAGLGDNFEFKKYFSDFNFKRLFLRDLKHNWYLNGIDGVGTDVDEIASYLRKIIEEQAVKHVVTIGLSAGGYAAILFGCLLNTETIISFTPQSFMSKTLRFIYYDRRWKDRCNEIYKSEIDNERFLDLKKYAKSYVGKLNIFYDKMHRIDNIHGRRIKSKNIKRFNGLGGGHSLASKLRNEGTLTKYLHKADSKVFNI